MINIKEEFYDHPKTKLAHRLGGAEALLLWHQMKAYASKRGHGFVPEEAIQGFPLPIRNVRKAMDALVKCGELQPDGSRKPGLVEPVPHGWQLHDYLDHAMSSDELQERVNNDRARKQLQRDRSKLRTILVSQGVDPGDAQRAVRDMSRDQVTQRLVTLSRDSHVTQVEDGPVTGPCDPRASTRAQADAPARDPAQPSPARSDLDEASADPKTSQVIAREEASGSAAQRGLMDALQLPIRTRAQHVLDKRHLAEWSCPHQWPEVVQLAESFSTAMGWHSPRLTGPSATVLKLVELLAAFTEDELERATHAAPNDDFLNTGRKGLGSLSVEVVGRLLNPDRGPRKAGARQPDYAGEKTFSLAAALAEQERNQ